MTGPYFAPDRPEVDGNLDAARAYGAQWDYVLAALAGTGHQPGGVLLGPTTPASMKRHLSADVAARVSGIGVTCPAGDTVACAANDSYPRWVLWEIDDAGAMHATHGTATSMPELPRPTPGRAPHAADLLAVGQTVLDGLPTLDLRAPAVSAPGRSEDVNIVEDAGAAITIDWDAHLDHDITVTQNVSVTLTGPATPPWGTPVRLLFRQDGTGSHNVSAWHGSAIIWDSGTPPALWSPADAETLITLTWTGSHFVGSAKAFG